MKPAVKAIDVPPATRPSAPARYSLAREMVFRVHPEETS